MLQRELQAPSSTGTRPSMGWVAFVRARAVVRCRASAAALQPLPIDRSSAPIETQGRI